MSKCGSRKYYTVYNNHTDEVVIVNGTKKECAEVMGIKPETLHSIRWLEEHGRKTKWHIVEGKEYITLPDNPTVADRLRYHRRLLGLSIGDLAKLTGICNSTIACYDRGASEMPFSYAIRIADVLGISLDYLAGR